MNHSKFALITAIFMVLFLSSCSSNSVHYNERKNDKIKKNYRVTDAALAIRPGWITAPEKWLKDHDLYQSDYQYYSYESTPKIDRDLACTIAKSNLRIDIAKQVSSNLKQKMGHVREGMVNANEDFTNGEQYVKEYTENILADTTKLNLTGVEIQSVYWEKRTFAKELGNAKEFTGHTCAVLGRIKKDSLNKMIARAERALRNKKRDNNLKIAVKNYLSSEN